MIRRNRTSGAEATLDTVTSRIRSVIVDNTPPAVTILTPEDGESVQGTRAVGVGARDASGVRLTWLVLDDADVGSRANSMVPTTMTSSFIVDTGTLTNGSHVLIARAEDAAGNVAESEPVILDVDNTSGLAIGRIQPPSGAGGTIVTITGSGFSPGATSVRVGDVPAEILDVTTTGIRARVPSGNSPGLSTLKIQSSAGMVSAPFVYLASRATQAKGPPFGPAVGIAISGTFSSDMRIEDVSFQSESGWDPFVARFTDEGDLQWLKSFSGGSADEVANHIQLIETGEVYVAGYYRSSITIGPETYESLGEYPHKYEDIFIAKLSAAGEPLWSRAIASLGRDYLRDLVLRDDGSILLAATLDGSADLGDGDEGPDETHSVLVAYSAVGEYVWSRRYGGDPAPYIRTVALADDGGFFIGGFFDGGARVGPFELFAAGNPDAFLARLSAAGDPIWVRRFGGAAFDYIEHIVPAPDGDLIVAGITRDYTPESTTFESDPVYVGGDPLPRLGRADFFLARIRP